MSSPTPSPSSGSRTAAYIVAGALATVPAFIAVWIVLGFGGAVSGVLVLWAAGVVWLLKKRQEDPAWDHRPTS